MLGRVFALSTDEEQAAFLNVVGRVMKGWDRITDGSGYDMQIYRIANRLDMNGREFVRRLATYAEEK